MRAGGLDKVFSGGKVSPINTPIDLEKVGFKKRYDSRSTPYQGL